VNGDPEPTGSAGSTTEPYYDRSIFSRPTGTGIEGFGNSGRNRYRRPPVWNLDMSLFKAFAIGRVRPELRIEVANLFNTVNWGAPNTDINSPLFMTFSPSNASGFNERDTTANSPGARRIQIGLRFAF
jgi:hypothetical protein